jgi:hypothetical protein
MEIFEARFLGGNLRSWLKNHRYWELCLVYAITSWVNMELSRKKRHNSQNWWFFNSKLRFPPKPLLQIFPCKNPSKIMITTSHMQNIIQINPCLLMKLSRKQDVIIIIFDGFLHGNIWTKSFGGEIYIYIRGLHSVQSGVLPIYYSDHAAIYSILQ